MILVIKLFFHQTIKIRITNWKVLYGNFWETFQFHRQIFRCPFVHHTNYFHYFAAKFVGGCAVLQNCKFGFSFACFINLLQTVSSMKMGPKPAVVLVLWASCLVSANVSKLEAAHSALEDNRRDFQESDLHQEELDSRSEEFCQSK